MLKGLLKTVCDRLLPSIDSNTDGTSHCHEAAFDPDSFPDTVRRKMQNQPIQTQQEKEHD